MIRLPVTKDGTTGSTSFFQHKQKGEDINGFNSIKGSPKELSTLPLINEGGDHFVQKSSCTLTDP